MKSPKESISLSKKDANLAGRWQPHRLGSGARVQEFFTIGQIAEFLGVSTKTIQRSIKSGALAVHRIGGLVRISEADFASFLALRRHVGTMSDGVV